MEAVHWQLGARIADTTVNLRSGRDSSFMVSRWPALLQHSPKWPEMTKKRFWHCLTALPEVADALIDMLSVRGAVYGDLHVLGQQFFALLCISNGTLRFDVSRKARKPRKPYSRSVLVVKHAVEYGANFSNLWQIDGAGCIVHPPHLHFCRLPKQITAVHIYIYIYIYL